MPARTDPVAAKLRQGPARAAELTRALGISQPALSRAMQSLLREGRAVKIGAARSAMYGLLRAVPGAGSTWPVYQVDDRGAIHERGRILALERNHYFADCVHSQLRGMTEDIPYFLQDQRPEGFMGRAIPGTYPELALPPRVIDWTDDHYLTYLTRRGYDCVSDLVVGAEALTAYLSSLRARRPVLAANRSNEYPTLATIAMAGGSPGSSAHGEHPKFTALLDEGNTRSHVIVKFSPPRTTPVGQRWADLLVAEHIAHEHLSSNGFAASRSSVFDLGGRTFLEVERFDRVGDEGRRGVVSLFALDASRYGHLDRWSKAAERLRQDELLSIDDVERIRMLEAFAMLIANTDRHFGNLAVFDRYEGSFDLAPVYDMLPMLFAPQSDQIVERDFDPPDPTPDTLSVWSRARTLAEAYWELLCRDVRISGDFRALSGQSLAALRATPHRTSIRAAE